MKLIPSGKIGDVIVVNLGIFPLILFSLILGYWDCVVAGIVGLVYFSYTHLKNH